MRQASLDGCLTDVETNTAQSTTDGIIPVEDLIIFEGEMHGQVVEILKDDGRNTNVVSKDCARRNAHLFQLEEADLIITHSKRNSEEKSGQVIVQAEVKVGLHSYTSNWAVVDCRCDVLLGMPWHKENKPEVDYSIPPVSVGRNLYS